MEGGGYRATTPEENREEERQTPEPATQRYCLRHHRGAQGRRAWPLRLLQPHDRGKIQGREGRAAGGGETRRTSQDHLAYVPPHFRLQADPRRCGHRDRKSV